MAFAYGGMKRLGEKDTGEDLSRDRKKVSFLCCYGKLITLWEGKEGEGCSITNNLLMRWVSQSIVQSLPLFSFSAVMLQTPLPYHCVILTDSACATSSFITKSTLQVVFGLVFSGNRVRDGVC